MDYTSVVRAFDISCSSSSELFSSINLVGQLKPGGPGETVGCTDHIPATPNSSMSSSSAEVAAEEDSGKSKKDRQEEKLVGDASEISKKVGGNQSLRSTDGAAPLWGVMKHLYHKIPDIASKKSQKYGYLLEQEKALNSLPDFPDFELSLRPEDYNLPEMNPAWDGE